MCVEERTSGMDAHQHERIFADVVDDAPNVLQEGQCPWCGFSDHVRKTSAKCPQHREYSGSKYKKGDKIRESWIPGSRRSHEPGRVPLTPTSARCAPECAEWKTSHWTEGTDALNGWTPEEFDTSTCLPLTRTKPSYGWTAETKSTTLFDHFYKVMIMLCA